MSPRPLSSERSAFEPALALAREGRLDEAMAALDQLASVSDAGVGQGAAASLAYAQVARQAEAAGDAATALRALDAAVALGPGFADLHYRRGCLLIDQQRQPAARAALERALAINPRFLAARLELALLDAREGMLRESLAALRSLAAEQRVAESHTFDRGLHRLQQAEWEEAASLLRSAIRSADHDLEEALERHRALMAGGDAAAALAALQEAVIARPSYPDLHYLLGKAELEAGFAGDALCSLARALQFKPDFHAARVHFARALETLGSLEEAREQVRQVLRAEPEHAQALEFEARWARPEDVRSRLAAAPEAERKAS